jgi:hypothetical protein
MYHHTVESTRPSCYRARTREGKGATRAYKTRMGSVIRQETIMHMRGWE